MYHRSRPRRNAAVTQKSEKVVVAYRCKEEGEAEEEDTVEDEGDEVLVDLQGMAD